MGSLSAGVKAALESGVMMTIDVAPDSETPKVILNWRHLPGRVRLCPVCNP